ncbi:uracil-DNA glycosylase [Kangiella aquimarina]|uniref:Uracil-DNA glycosylase n=1 Tax=Kangiella aquimarina TaxID=261965 RepID=A0ABZ0X120_9GAMM|nr:uracil-DNA glycosylase [Kangiella aquimarina]WQG84235.1 uracil-DNA glycosylase [Kangiella aquimarina]
MSEPISSWAEVLEPVKKQTYFKELLSFIESERESGKTIYPPKEQVFAALSLTEFAQVKVVILGQDPYHGPNQANGLCFSVNPEQPLPPSLRNIYKELVSDIGCTQPINGDLSGWAKQGVLLLNTVLTVEAAKPNSHKGRGWEIFTDEVIQALNRADQPIIFLLWGSQAQAKSSLIKNPKHTILTAPHPSPLSAHRGFFGCKHFSKTNQILVENDQTPIKWC